jgi:hypothetical protein
MARTNGQALRNWSSLRWGGRRVDHPPDPWSGEKRQDRDAGGGPRPRATSLPSARATSSLVHGRVHHDHRAAQARPASAVLEMHPVSLAGSKLHECLPADRVHSSHTCWALGHQLQSAEGHATDLAHSVEQSLGNRLQQLSSPDKGRTPAEHRQNTGRKRGPHCVPHAASSRSPSRPRRTTLQLTRRQRLLRHAKVAAPIPKERCGRCRL